MKTQLKKETYAGGQEFWLIQQLHNEGSFFHEKWVTLFHLGDDPDGRIFDEKTANERYEKVK